MYRKDLGDGYYIYVNDEFTKYIRRYKDRRVRDKDLLFDIDSSSLEIEAYLVNKGIIPKELCIVMYDYEKIKENP